MKTTKYDRWNVRLGNKLAEKSGDLWVETAETNACMGYAPDLKWYYRRMNLMIDLTLWLARKFYKHAG